jgi:hypothetical protein
MISKFDEAINNALARKIDKAKKKRIKLKKRLNGSDDKVKPPNTPDNLPVHQDSPALRKGVSDDFAQMSVSV